MQRLEPRPAVTPNYETYSMSITMGGDTRNAGGMCGG